MPNENTVDARDALLDEIENRLRNLSQGDSSAEDMRRYAAELLQHLQDARTDLRNIES